MKKCFLCVIFLFCAVPVLSARQNPSPEEYPPEPSASQAQATMASLFGRGAKMPGIPKIDGTIAIPSFDSSGMKIDENSLVAAERGERAPKEQVTGNVHRGT